MRFSKVIFLITIFLILSVGIAVYMSFSLTVDMNKMTLFSLQTNKMWSKIPYIVFNMEKGVRLDFWMVRGLVKNLEDFNSNTRLSMSFLYDPQGEVKKASNELYLVVGEFYKKISDQYNKMVTDNYEEVRISLEYGIDKLENTISEAVKRIQFWFIILLLLIFFSVVISIVLVFYPVYRDFRYLENNRKSMMKLKELKTIKLKKSGE